MPIKCHNPGKFLKKSFQKRARNWASKLAFRKKNKKKKNLTSTISIRSSVKRKTLRNNAFHCIFLKWPNTCTRIIVPRVMLITILLDTSLLTMTSCIFCVNFTCSWNIADRAEKSKQSINQPTDLCLGIEKNISKQK